MDRPTPNTNHVSLWTIEEEIVNGITHGVGLVLSVAGLCGLVVLTAIHGTVWHIVACSIYGGSLVLLYGASTLYHAVRCPTWKPRLRTFDHIAIYFLIAGTYMPFTLVTLRGPWGWTLFGIIWALALCGALFKLSCRRKFEGLSLAIYLAMGWLCVIAAKPILEVVPTGGILWLAAGGVTYTVGTIFYALDSLPYFHAIWHLFVICGSFLHYCAVMFYVVPLTA